MASISARSTKAFQAFKAAPRRSLAQRNVVVSAHKQEQSVGVMPGVLAALVALTTAGAAFEPALLRPAFADEEEYSAPTSAIGRRRELLRQAREKAEAAAAGNVKQAESAAAADEAVNDANEARRKEAEAMKRELSSRVKSYDKEAGKSAKLAPKAEQEPSPAFEIPGMSDFVKSLGSEEAAPTPRAAPAPAVVAPAPAPLPAVPAPKPVAPKVEAPKFEAPKFEAPKFEAPKFEAPKFEAPKFEAPKFEAPKAAPAPAVKAAPSPAPKPAPAPAASSSEDIWSKYGYEQAPVKKADAKKPGTVVEKKAETKKADKKAGKRKGPLPLFLGEFLVAGAYYGLFLAATKYSKEAAAAAAAAGQALKELSLKAEGKK